MKRWTHSPEASHQMSTRLRPECRVCEDGPARPSGWGRSGSQETGAENLGWGVRQVSLWVLDEPLSSGAISDNLHNPFQFVSSTAK